MKRTRWLIGLLCAVLVTGPALAASVSKGLRPGKQPPDFSASDLNGTTQSLKAYRGKVVVLHFWATWCPYCRNEAPKLKTIHQRWGGKDVQVLAVSVDEDQGKLHQFVKAQQLPYTVIWEGDAQDALSDLYAVSGIPVTYIIGRDGLVAERFTGAADLVPAVARVVKNQS